MKFRCEDLAGAGVVLVPRDSAAFAPLLAQVKAAILNPPPGSPPRIGDESRALPDESNPASAILWNQSGKPICAYTLIWTYESKSDGEIRTTHSSHVQGVGQMPSLLHPFGLAERRRSFETYWRTILPHSRRYVADGCVLGSNADVRPPAPEEQWKGGVMRWGGPRETLPGSEVTSALLTLDAVFFATGELAGPDSRLLWDQITGTARLYQETAEAARRGLEAGLSTERIFADIENITGSAAPGHPAPPPPPPPPNTHFTPEHHLEMARRHLARMIEQRRGMHGDENTLAMLSAWAQARVPQYRRS